MHVSWTIQYVEFILGIQKWLDSSRISKQMNTETVGSVNFVIRTWTVEQMVDLDGPSLMVNSINLTQRWNRHLRFNSQVHICELAKCRFLWSARKP